MNLLATTRDRAQTMLQRIYWYCGDLGLKRFNRCTCIWNLPGLQLVDELLELKRLVLMYLFVRPKPASGAG